MLEANLQLPSEDLSNNSTNKSQEYRRYSIIRPITSSIHTKIKYPRLQLAVCLENRQAKQTKRDRPHAIFLLFAVTSLSMPLYVKGKEKKNQLTGRVKVLSFPSQRERNAFKCYVSVAARESGDMSVFEWQKQQRINQKRQMKLRSILHDMVATSFSMFVPFSVCPTFFHACAVREANSFKSESKSSAAMFQNG